MEFLGIAFNAQFFMNLLSIVLIDIVLAGDNSIVIAMAVQGLPKEQRFKGIVFGALAAVILRVGFTFFAAQLLGISFVKLVGGILILWIALKLMADSNEDDHKESKADTVWKAVWVILVADFTMSLDNILAVAGASHGSFGLLLFGLGLSIPLVVFTSTMLSKLMAKFPIILWIGAAVLGKVGVEMMITDPFIVNNVLAPLNMTEMIKNTLHAKHILVTIAEIIGAVGIVAVAFLMNVMKNKRSETKTGSTSLPDSVADADA
jgi:YjbE family integral membrane protein